jgi:hypothetical protein
MVGIFLCGSLRGVARFLVNYVKVGITYVARLGYETNPMYVYLARGMA